MAGHAAVESGKLYISGGAWNRVAYPVFPAVQTIAVAAILHVPWRAHDQSHAFLIEFKDADGQKMGGRLEGRFEAQTPPDARSGDYSIVPVAVQVGGFVFPRAGDYAAVFEVDGTEISRWQFRAVQTFGLPGGIPVPGQSPNRPPAVPPPSDIDSRGSHYRSSRSPDLIVAGRRFGPCSSTHRRSGRLASTRDRLVVEVSRGQPVGSDHESPMQRSPWMTSTGRTSAVAVKLLCVHRTSRDPAGD